jgi:hypothetical protein
MMAQAVDAYRKAVDVSQLEELSENWPLQQLQLIRALQNYSGVDRTLCVVQMSWCNISPLG